MDLYISFTLFINTDKSISLNNIKAPAIIDNVAIIRPNPLKRSKLRAACDNVATNAIPKPAITNLKASIFIPSSSILDDIVPKAEDMLSFKLLVDLSTSLFVSTQLSPTFSYCV